MRSRRVRTSCSVMSSAWPMCRLPVTLGGGMTMVHGSRSARSGRNRPALSQCRYQRSSIALGSKVLGSSLIWGAVSDAALQHQPLRPDVVALLQARPPWPEDQAEDSADVVVPAVEVRPELDARPIPKSRVIEQPDGDFGLQLDV